MLLTCLWFRLQKITRGEGNVRLSIDDGPAATEFLQDDYDEDLADDEPLALADRAVVGGGIHNNLEAARTAEMPSSQNP